jgi:5'-3' exonuclease
MANLNEQLKYFIHVKLTTDPLWENVDVHLSGHLVGILNKFSVLFYFIFIRHQEKVNIKLWNIFDIHVHNRDIISIQDIVYMDLMQIW